MHFPCFHLFPSTIMTTPTFHIQTFGCQMNVNDSDWVVRSLKARGFAPAPLEDASVYILNTCSVRDKPEQKVYSELGRIARYCKVHKKKPPLVCVGGCVAQQVGERLVKRFPEVRLLFGTDGIAGVPDAIVRLLDEPLRRISLLDFVQQYEERDALWQAGQVPVSAFVNIMQGCNNFCTYCIVPYVRGRQKSRTPHAVLAECRTLVAAGTKEITLLGQNVNAYGQDGLAGETTFVGLLEQICAIEGLERVRFLTSHPKDVPAELIALLGKEPKLCPRLHLPLQSGSDAVLARMNRKYTVAGYLDVVQRLRAARPGMTLTTDIIVGFPGETEADFEATMEMMRTVGYVSSFSFIYSDRPGAKAVLLPGKIERSVALERLGRLQVWQAEYTEGLLHNMHGSIVPVLLDTPLPSSVVLGEGADKSARSGGKERAVNSAGSLPEIQPEGQPEQLTAAGEAVCGSEQQWQLWQGKTPHDIKVVVRFPSSRKGLQPGTLVQVQVTGASKQALKGLEAGDT